MNESSGLKRTKYREVMINPDMSQNIELKPSTKMSRNISQPPNAALKCQQV